MHPSTWIKHTICATEFPSFWLVCFLNGPLEQLWEAKRALFWNIFFIFAIKTLFEFPAEHKGKCAVWTHCPTGKQRFHSWLCWAGMWFCAAATPLQLWRACIACMKSSWWSTDEQNGKKRYSEGDCFIFIFFLRKVETGLHICCRCFDKVASSWSPVADPRTVLFSLQRSSFWNLGLSISSWSPCSFCGRLLMFRINSWASSNSFSPISFFTRSFQALSFGWPSNTSRPVPTGWGTGLDWS